MRHYEILLLIHPDRHDQVSSMVDRYTQSIQEANGVIHRLETTERRLEYPIKNLHKAYYVLLNVECTVEVKKNLKDAFDFNDEIISHLIIRKEKAVTEPSVLGGRPIAKNTSSEKEKGGALATSEPLKKKKYRTLPDIKDVELDYKDAEFLSNYLTDTKKMGRRRATGASAKQQHRLSQAVKRARLVGLLPHCDKYFQPPIH